MLWEPWTHRVQENGMDPPAEPGGERWVRTHPVKNAKRRGRKRGKRKKRRRKRGRGRKRKEKRGKEEKKNNFLFKSRDWKGS